MPIFIPAGVVNPPPPKTATSVDGILTATAYEKGVYLEADFSDQEDYNYAPDPSLEGGSPDGWTAGPGAGVSTVQSMSRTGDWSLRTINEGARSVFHVEDVEAGREYTLSGWVYNRTVDLVTDGSFESGTSGFTPNPYGTMIQDNTRARTGDHSLNLTRVETNYASDPSFESGTGDFIAGAAGDIAQDSTHVHSGSQALLVTHNTTANDITAYNLMGIPDDASNGDLITVRAWVYCPTRTVTSNKPVFRIGGGGVQGQNSADFTGPYDEWTLIEVTADITDATKGAVFYIYAAEEVGAQLWVDDLVIATYGVFNPVLSVFSPSDSNRPQAGDTLSARVWTYVPDLLPPVTEWGVTDGQIITDETAPERPETVLEWTAPQDQINNSPLFSSPNVPATDASNLAGSVYFKKGNAQAPDTLRMRILCYDNSGSYIGPATGTAGGVWNDIPIGTDEWTPFNFSDAGPLAGTVSVRMAFYPDYIDENPFSAGDKIRVAAPELLPQGDERPQMRVGGSGITGTNTPDFTGPYNVWTPLELNLPVNTNDSTVIVYLYGSDFVGRSVWFDDLEVTVNGSPVRGNGPTGLRMLGAEEVSTDIRDDWVHLVSTVTAPTTGPGRFELLAPTGEGEYCWWDDVGITEGDKPVSFSGDTPDADGYQYSWTGTPHQSASLRLRPSPLPADFNMKKVRFVRLPDQPVRSGNDAWAPWGAAIAFDMEAPLGRASTWIAYPIAKDGTMGEPSEGVTLHTAGLPEGCYDSRIVSTSQPELTREVMLTLDNVPEFSYQARNSLTPVQGSRYRAGGTDKHLAATATLTFFTEEAEDQTEMYDLLDSGVLLFQSLPGADLADFYLLVGDFSMALTDMGTAIPSRRWTVPITVVGRPSPFGAPLIIPGRSYDELAEDYATYDVLAQTFPSYHIMSRPSS